MLIWPGGGGCWAHICCFASRTQMPMLRRCQWFTVEDGGEIWGNGRGKDARSRPSAESPARSICGLMYEAGEALRVTPLAAAVGFWIGRPAGYNARHRGITASGHILGRTRRVRAGGIDVGDALVAFLSQAPSLWRRTVSLAFATPLRIRQSVPTVQYNTHMYEKTPA